VLIFCLGCVHPLASAAPAAPARSQDREAGSATFGRWFRFDDDEVTPFDPANIEHVSYTRAGKGGRAGGRAGDRDRASR
jgi:hypothetical protein